MHSHRIESYFDKEKQCKIMQCGSFVTVGQYLQ